MPEQEVPELGKLETDFTPAYLNWRDKPSSESNSALLSAVSPVIDAGLRSFGGSSMTSPTLRSKARRVVLHAVKSYNPERATLRTHLLTHMQRLQRLAANEQAIISVPEQVLLQQNHLRDTTGRLKDWLGREPSDAELADDTGLSLKRINYIRQWRPPIASGRFEGGGEEGSPADAPGVSVLGKPEDTGWLDYVYHSLPPVDQVVMGHGLGLYGQRQHTPAEIAQKLGISQSAVSQRAARIQALMDQREELGIL